MKNENEVSSVAGKLSLKKERVRMLGIKSGVRAGNTRCGKASSCGTSFDECNDGSFVAAN